MKKVIERYLVLIVFIVMTLVGVAIRYLTDKKSWLWEFWGTIDVAFAVALGIMAFFAYKEFIQAEDEVFIYFNVEGKKVNTGLSLLRKDCSRGEILGILGMMQKNSEKRFAIETRRLPALLKELQEIQKGNIDKVMVDMSQEEFEQYDIEQLDIKEESVSDDN